MVRPSPAAVFGAAVGVGLSAIGVWTGMVPSRAVGSKSTNGVVGGLAAQAPRALKPSTRQPALVRIPDLRRSSRFLCAFSARLLGRYLSRRIAVLLLYYRFVRSEEKLATPLRQARARGSRF